jgi:hypothetical protein
MNKNFSFLLKYIDYEIIQRIRYRLGFRKKAWAPNKIYKTSWLDQICNKTRCKIREPENTISIGPTTPNQPVEKKTITLPLINQYTFTNSVRFNISTSAFLSNNRLFIERVHDVSTLRCKYPTGPHEIRGHKLTAFPKQESIDFTCGIFLGGNGASNYYHWLIEILPKMEFVNELGKDFSKYPLLVSKSVQKYQSFQDSLNFFANSRPVIYLDDKKYFTVQNLITFTTPSNIPFNLIKNEVSRVEDFRINPESIHFIRETILTRHINPNTPNKRIFLTLERPRRKYNEEEVFKIFERYGFIKVYTEQLSFQQQVDLMQGAEMIAGPTGAAWTNLIFCKSGVQCLCWMDEFISKFSSFSNIAHIVDANLTYLLYQSGSSSTSDCYSNAYTLDLNQVEATLKKLLHTSAQTTRSIIPQEAGLSHQSE